MFGFFNKKKEYVSCDCLEYGVHFSHNGLFHCATYFHSNANNIPIVRISDDIVDSYKKFIKQKEKDKLSHRKGKIIDRCENCFLLEKKEWEKSDKINRIAISSNLRCNSNCIYCFSHRNKEWFNSIPDSPVYDFIMQLAKENKIDENCNVEFGGGEPTLHFEFEKIMQFCSEQPNFKMQVYTSGIKYSESIAEAIRRSKCQVIISIDSSNSELYKKVKTVDCFDSVVNTLSTYIDAQKQQNNNRLVVMKYIIVPNVNDKEEYIMEFLQLAKKLGCNEVRCDVENNWYKNNSENKEKMLPILKLLKYLDLNANKLSIVQDFNMVPRRLISNYKQDYDDIIIN